MSRNIRRMRRFSDLITEAGVLALWHEYKYQLRARALAHRDRGINWRHFRTAQSCLILLPDGSLHIIDSANHKPNEFNDDGRVCAEEWPLDWSQEKSGIILVMALASRPQADDFTGVAINFMLPCGKSCRPKMRLALEEGRILPYTRLDIVNSRRPKLVLEVTIPEILSIAEPANNSGMIA